MDQFAPRVAKNREATNLMANPARRANRVASAEISPSGGAVTSRARRGRRGGGDDDSHLGWSVEGGGPRTSAAAAPSLLRRPEGRVPAVQIESEAGPPKPSPSPMEASDELRSFEATGIYRLDGCGTGVAFVDPVRLINASYQRFRVASSAYYSRSFGPSLQGGGPDTELAGERRKRKRNRKPKPRELNAMERIAEARHQEARPLLLRAHESLCNAKDLLGCLPKIINNEEHTLDVESGSEKNFVELGSSWRAPFYEITLCFPERLGLCNEEGSFHVQRTSVPLFNRIVNVEASDDVEGEFQNRCYILPRENCFLMKCNPNNGYNFIVIDPPWENGCVRQKDAYPTLPNRYLLYLPMQELAHPDGALLVLWITNREKLRMFVEKELFPYWGVKNSTVFYWLKVKPDGSLIGDLDLFHHRPYECLLLGYINVNTEAKPRTNFRVLEGSQVIMSVPGANSRKPPLQKELKTASRLTRRLPLLPYSVTHSFPTGYSRQPGTDKQWALTGIRP
ncbi:hypothetical protein ACP70R_017249 [Stipagrostis hirtigluma subsp. patula]